MKEDILGQSQHYAGVSFDVGQKLTNAQRTAMRNTAINSGVWSYVEPAYLTPTWEIFPIGKWIISVWYNYQVVSLFREVFELAV